jgi:hypothetical protein
VEAASSQLRADEFPVTKIIFEVKYFERVLHACP